MSNATRAAWLAILLSTLTPWATAATFTQTLLFEDQCLDLDSGEVREACTRHPAESWGWDLLVTYNADGKPAAAILHNASRGVEIAYLQQVAFADITPDHVHGVAFTKQGIDEPFAIDSVVLVRTDQGAIYKLGDPLEDERGVTFDYALLVPGP